MFSILVLPNITYTKNLESDSFIVLIRNVIRELTKMRKDLQFTLILPELVQSLMLPNVQQVFLEIPTYPNQMRCHFNTREFLNAVNFKENDFDVVYSLLPEWTSQAVNTLYNTTNLRPKIVGACHWFELPENTKYEKTLLTQNLAGILEMEECGVNSQWLKNLVIGYASKIFSSSTTDELDSKIQPQYLGIDSIDISEKEFDGKIKTILFNSRDDSYTGFSWFIEEMDKLWQKRKDFKVITTIASIKRPYLEKSSCLNRKSYLDTIKECYIHVGCFEQYSAWSIATTDALSRGVPSVLPNDFCYPEMVGANYSLLYNGRKEFVEKVVWLLDNPQSRQDIKSQIRKIIEPFLWENQVPKWYSGWKFLDGPWKCVGDKSESYQEILKIIKAKKQITKKSLLKQLSWGRGIPFSDYRNRLREEGIKTLRNGYKI